MSRPAPGRSPARRALALAAVAALPAIAGAQPRTPLTVTDAGRDVELTSALPVPVVVTLASPASRDAVRMAALVPAKGRATARKATAGQQYAAVALEPVSWVVGRNEAPLCQVPRTDAELKQRNREIEARLADLRREGARNEEEQAALATAEANLRYEQRWDSVYTTRYNAWEMEWVKQFPLVLGPAYEQRERERAKEDSYAALGQMVAVFSEADDAKRSAIWTEANNLEPLVAASDSMLKVMSAELTRSSTIARAGAQGLATLADAMADERRGFEDAVAGTETARRACAGAAGIEDWIVFRGTPRDPRQAVVLGEAKFDRGGSHPMVFRRVKGTDRWIGAVYWPTDATRLTVDARVDGRTRTIGRELTPDRPSLAAMREDARRGASRLKKRLRDLKFREEGGDGVKTIYVP